MKFYDVMKGFALAAYLFLLWTFLEDIIYAHVSNNGKSKNVLVIVADDLGFELNGYGNDIIQTPHIFELIKSGITYNNGFTTVSSCSPSRSTILTGLPSHQNGNVFFAL